MPTEIHIEKEVPIPFSSRVKQIEAMFDVPATDKTAFVKHGLIDLEKQPWNVGLIVGPSGSGKSTILQEVFGGADYPNWDDKPVIDNFDARLGIAEIASACSSVGFNTIPAWTRPYHLLSTGEQFRVHMARLISAAHRGDLVVVDEFTSVVDRQVARIASHAVAKYARSKGIRFVAASCHYDIIDWLQPDWIFEPAEMLQTWRELHPRPEIRCHIGQVEYAAWERFAPFHYMSASLNKAARCYGLWAGLEGEQPELVSFCGVLHRPHPRVRDIMGVSRVVTLPDWQGVGLAMALLEKLGAAYAALGKRFRNYPAHPAFISSHARRPHLWSRQKEGGTYSPRRGETSTVGGFGGRPCAVFEYIGPMLNESEARLLIERG